MNKTPLLLLLALTACGKATDTSLATTGSTHSTLSPANDLRAPDAPAPAATPAPSAPQLTTIQQAVAVANDTRKKNGLSGFTIDEKLMAVAQAHAEDMLARHYFDHNTPEGLTPFQRMDKAGVDYQAAAENIAMGTTDANKVFDLWMNSPGHKHNLLNSTYTRHGIGYAGGYWVHDFAN